MDSEHHVLRRYRYIELNPVRARIIDDPVVYRWSSCAANTGQRPGSGLIPHAAWRALGHTDAERAAAYRTLLDEALDEGTLAEIRAYLQQQRALGRDRLSRRGRGQNPALCRNPPRPPAATHAFTTEVNLSPFSLFLSWRPGMAIRQPFLRWLAVHRRSSVRAPDLQVLSSESKLRARKLTSCPRRKP